MISQKVIEQGLKVLESAMTGFTQEGAKVLDEYINFLIFCNVLNLFKGVLWGFLIFAVVRFLNGLIKATEERMKDEEQSLKDMKSNEGRFMTRYDINGAKESIQAQQCFKYLFLTVASTVLFLVSLEDVKTIGYIAIAPKVYLIKEGAKFIKSEEVKK